MRLFQLAVAIVVAVLCEFGFVIKCDAASINVAAGESIQAAIDAAHPGDTVLLGAGEHFQSTLCMKPHVSLVGAAAQATVVRPLRRECVVLADTGTRLENLTIVDGEVGVWTSSYDFLASRCLFIGNDTALILVGHFTYSNYRVENCIFTGNATAINVDCTGRADIRDCDIHGNRVAVMSGDGDSAILNACRISCNLVGLKAYENAVPIATNCIFRGNGTAVRSGGHSNPELLNCTVWLNTYGLRTYEDYPTAITVSNSIISASEQAAVDLHFGPLGSVEITYSNVEQGWPGQGNIDADPQFLDPFSLDYRLQPSSPCIDAGDNSAPHLPEADFAGMRRTMYGGKNLSVDMGAYEYYINDVNLGPGATERTITWSSLARKTYCIFYTRDLLTWHRVVESFPSAGNRTTSWTDDGSKIGLAPSRAPRRFYRILENP